MSTFDSAMEVLSSNTVNINSGYLMLEDIEVLYYNFDDDYIASIERSLLPFPLRKVFDSYCEDNLKSIMKALFFFKEWLSRRVINSSIGNYKQLCTYFRIAQNDSVDYKSTVALSCRAVSIEDAYWVKFEGENKSWKAVCPYNNHMQNIVIESLSSSIPSITGDRQHPNLTMSGTFPKTLVRDDNYGSGIVMFKLGKTTDDINAKVECASSRLLDCVVDGTIDVVRYLRHELKIDGVDRICSVSDSYYLPGYSVVKAFDLYDYLGYTNFVEFLQSSDFILTKFANMILINYLFANTDGHLDNYAFYMCNKTGEIVDMVPLYDFNYSFVSDILGKNINDTLCQTLNDGRTMFDITEEYIKYSDVKFDRDRFMKTLGLHLPEAINNGFIHERISFIESLGITILL